MMLDKSLESPTRRVTVVSWNYHHGRRHCVSETVNLLQQEGLLERLISNTYEVYDSNLEKIKPNPKYPVKLFHLILRLKYIFARKYKKTQFREWLFDFFASKNLGQPCLIYLDAERFPLVVNYARTNKIQTICYQRIAHVNYLTSVVREEKKKREKKREKKKLVTGYLDSGLNNRRLECIENVDFILSHSEFVRDTDIASGLNEDKIKVVYGCVDTEIYKPLEKNIFDPTIVLFVGTAPLLKGLFYLLDAWELIQKNIGNSQLWIIGNKLADFEKRYDGLENVRFFGHQKNMVPIYQKASLLVQPSLVDAGPKAVTEGMSSGLPVIVSNAIGYHEIVENGVNGFVVPAKDHEILADRIDYCIAHPEELERMGANARNCVKGLSHQYHAKTVVDTIKSIVKSGTLVCDN